MSTTFSWDMREDMAPLRYSSSEAITFRQQAAIREMYEETGLTLELIPSEFGRPFFTTDGMTDESCCLVFGRCKGLPTSEHQEDTEDIQVVLADKTECRRILREENASIQCAYMMMHFISCQGDPFAFLSGGEHV